MTHSIIENIAHVITTTDPTADESAALFNCAAHINTMSDSLRTIARTNGQHADTLQRLAAALHDAARNFEIHLWADQPAKMAAPNSFRNI